MSVNLEDLEVDTNYESQGVNVGDFLKNLDSKRSSILRFIPTDDDEVKLQLREYGQPITLFGEDKADRRERLMQYVAENGIDLGQQDEEMEEIGDDEDIEEEFYTPSSTELVEARKFITANALERSKIRIKTQLEQSSVTLTKQLNIRRNLNSSYQKYELHGSQLTSTRTVSNVSVNQSSKQILAGSWNGDIKLLDSNLEILKEFDQIEGKISGLDWSPTSRNHFISSSNTINLWQVETATPIASFDGHDQRVVRVKYHPTGKYIASASFDQTWRLWDVETQQQLLLQEGHSKEVYTLGFQQDGSLLASAGLDAMGYVWDLRLGKSIMVLNGHIKPIYGLDWSSNGYQIATGSGDGSIKVWDLRKADCVYTIPAHNKIVSDLKFSTDGNALISSSYDNTVKIFSADNWIHLKTLEGHSDKVMSCDITDDFIISSGWDKSVKIWKS